MHGYSVSSSNHHDPVIHEDGSCTGSTDEAVEISIAHIGIPDGRKVLRQYAVIDREALDASDHSPIYADVEF